MSKRRFLTPLEAALLVCLALVVWLLLPRQAGAQVVVTRGGEELGRYALDVPTQVSIQGANGFSLTLVVEDGQAHVEDSTCPDLICQHHAPVDKTGESIICLPGQVSITVEGGGDLDQDAVSG